MLTGGLHARTGLTRPILAGDVAEKNPREGKLIVAAILSHSGYHSVVTGKWYAGELKGMRPHEIGFDEFHGYYASQKELTQQFDARRYPDLVLNPERAAKFRDASGDIDLYYGRKEEKDKIVGKTRSVEQFAEADQHLAEFTIANIKELAKGDQPFFIAHYLMRVHADNFPSQEFRGTSAAKYIDGIDQTSYLLDDNGGSRREKSLSGHSAPPLPCAMSTSCSPKSWRAEPSGSTSIWPP